MPLKYAWKLHPTKPKQAIGICPELPDTACHCFIQMTNDGTYWVALPTMMEDVSNKKFIFRDREIAKDFANDFLNNNLKTILQYQIHRIKDTFNIRTDKPLHYYSEYLQRLVEMTSSLDQKKKNSRRAA
jgi:hypothetical protein